MKRLMCHFCGKPGPELMPPGASGWRQLDGCYDFCSTRCLVQFALDGCCTDERKAIYWRLADELLKP